MLIIMEKHKIIKNKNKYDGVLIEPSELANNFFVIKAHKLGIVKTPEWLLQKAIQEQNNIPIDIDIEFLDFFRRPVLHNKEKIIKKGLEELKEGKDVYVTPKMFLILLDYLISNNMELDFEIDITEEDLEALKKDMEIKFIPYLLERLLKLFSVLYKNDIKQLQLNHLSFVAKVQLNLLDLNFKGDLSFFYNTNFALLKKIVQKIAAKYNISSNNLFNKILEEIEKAIYIQQQKEFEITNKANLVILFAKKESPLTKFL